MPVICRLPQKSSGSVVLTGTAIESDVASGKTFYNTDSNTKLTGTASGGGMVLPVGIDCRPTGNITIPSGVTSIAQCAFYRNTSLTSVTMANTITTIGDLAYYKCSNLTNVTLSTELISIRNQTFQQCNKLISVAIPNKVTTINGYAFEHCTSMTTITIPSSIITISHDVFGWCSSLEFVTLGTNFNASICLSDSTKFSRDTIMAMINAYANASGKTLTIGAANLAKLSTEDKAVASNKGLTLA